MVITKQLHYSYIIVVLTQLKLNCTNYMIRCNLYMISHMVRCACGNSCNLSNNIHPCRSTSSCNELQMFIATQKPNCEASCKSPHFIIMGIANNSFVLLCHKLGLSIILVFIALTQNPILSQFQHIGTSCKAIC